jgi:putative colanic acid biosynthesis acetyltransferase WcaF
LLLKCFGAELGRGCHVYPKVEIWAPWNLQLGDEVGIADGCILYNQAPVQIKKRAVISQGSYLCTGTHDYDAPSFPLVAKPIVVHEYAWVGAQAFVGPGVQIGEKAVVGARSVVIKDVRANTVVAGNPAKVIKERK